MISAKSAGAAAPARSSPLVRRRTTEIDIDRPGDLPTVDLIELYTGLECGLSAPHGIVVQLVSPDSDTAAEHLGFQLARAGARVLGKRVLLLRHQMTNGTAAFPLTDEPTGRSENASGDLKQTMVRIGGQDMFLANLGDWRPRRGAAAAFDELDGQLDELRGLLDMVLVVAPPADTDPSGVVMARHVDGSVIVVEAEQSRTAAALRLREALTRSGRPILGVVLTGRRRHIPRWLARFL